MEAHKHNALTANCRSKIPAIFQGMFCGTLLGKNCSYELNLFLFIIISLGSNAVQGAYSPSPLTKHIWWDTSLRSDADVFITTKGELPLCLRTFPSVVHKPVLRFYSFMLNTPSEFYSPIWYLQTNDLVSPSSAISFHFAWRLLILHNLLHACDIHVYDPSLYYDI
jgi:hypothetical protein